MNERAMSGVLPAFDSAKRGVLMIVLTGVVLGFGFNELALKGKSPHALPWIAQPKAALTSLESLTPAPPPGTEAPAVAVVPTHQDRPATKTAALEKSAPLPPPSAADPDDPMAGGIGTNPSTGLPEIPDLDRPLSVELATVRQFVDAKAALVLDAREPAEYEEGHIPGAVNVPYDTAGSDPARLQALDPGGRPIIIYCGGGTCEVSMSLAETLIYQFARRKVLVYTGGWPDWVAAGLPIAKGPAAGGSGK